MTPEETVKPKRIRKLKPQPCHVHDKCNYYNRLIVQKSVCRNLVTNKHADDKHYCLLHQPTEEKNNASGISKVKQFKRLFRGRLYEAKCKNINYDFRYVWFPKQVNLENYVFTTNVDFSSATFSDYAEFESATFSGDASFSLATFSGDAEFASATFSGYAGFASATFIGYADFKWTTFSGAANFSSANFRDAAGFYLVTFSNSAAFISTIFNDSAFSSATFCGTAKFESATFSGSAIFSSATFNDYAEFASATFSGYTIFKAAIFSRPAYFSSATFCGTAKFESATFSGDASFSSATFNGETTFNKTKFGKTGETKFFKAKFDNDVIFEETEFNNPVSFNSAIFGKESDIIFRKAFFAQYASFRYSTSEGYFRFINLRQSEENRFNFEEATFEKASRISFNKVRLRPNWFINIDSRKFSFTNISWENHKASNKELTEELESLEKRNHKEPDNFRLLIIAFRNLATNSEEFNRLEDASNFRESAFECEKLERKHKQKDWLTNVSKTLDKKFICWNFFSETKTIITELWKSIKHAPFDLVHFLYRLLSFYGESWFRAAWILVAVWIGFALFYFYFGEFGTDEKHKPLEFCYSLGYSLQVMTLQKPEPKPYGWHTVLFYGMETILAPLQAALLALAIRRKFMR
jgi:Pentapeptide repeats (9 copies)